jgi:hypothetical protein
MSHASIDGLSDDFGIILDLMVETVNLVFIEGQTDYRLAKSIVIALVD